MDLLDISGSWGVNIFLIISGYGIFRSFENHGIEGYWKRRIVSVYIPYLIYQPVCLLTLWMFSNVCLINIVFAVIGIDFGQLLDKTMWYISYQFVWYLIAWIAFLLWKKYGKNLICIIFLGIATIVIAAIGYLNVVWNHGSIAWAYCLSFPLGMFLAAMRNRRCKHITVFYIVVLIISIIIFVLRYGKQHSSFEEMLFALCASFIPLILISLFRIPEMKIFNKFAKYSFGMYLCEGVLLQIKLDIFIKTPILKITFVCIGSIFISFIMNFIVQKIQKQIR